MRPVHRDWRGSWTLPLFINRDPSIIAIATLGRYPKVIKKRTSFIINNQSTTGIQESEVRKKTKKRTFYHFIGQQPYLWYCSPFHRKHSCFEKLMDFRKRVNRCTTLLCSRFLLWVSSYTSARLEFRIRHSIPLIRSLSAKLVVRLMIVRHYRHYHVIHVFRHHVQHVRLMLRNREPMIFFYGTSVLYNVPPTHR